jgi:hypothetical protein
MRSQLTLAHRVKRTIIHFLILMKSRQERRPWDEWDAFAQERGSSSVTNCTVCSQSVSTVPLMPTVSDSFALHREVHPLRCRWLGACQVMSPRLLMRNKHTFRLRCKAIQRGFASRRRVAPHGGARNTLTFVVQSVV